MYDPEDELEIEWIPEEDDFVPPPRDDLTELDAKIDAFNNSDLPTFMIDKLCKKVLATPIGPVCQLSRLRT